MLQLIENRVLQVGPRTSYSPGFIRPTREISPGVGFSFDEKHFEEDADAYHRIETASPNELDGPPYLVADVSAWDDRWFALDLPLQVTPSTCVLRVKAYPVRQLHPKLHYSLRSQRFMAADDHGEVALPSFAVFEQFSNIRITIPEVPEGAFRTRLSIYVPSAPWFVLGFASLKVYGHA